MPNCRYFGYFAIVLIQTSFAVCNKCGYSSCPKPEAGKLNVHIVAHSHDDVGWLKTVDQYYYGVKSGYQLAGVQYIIESSIDALQNHPERKYIQVETAFFWQWWKKQDESVREKVRNLADNGQLEFVGGSWSMNDEAASNYQSTIDQFTWGFRRLNESVGKCGRPKIGWQIDPFGHSREQASLFAQFGFDAVLFGRLDYRDKIKRLKERTMEMMWRGSDDLGASSDIFTSVLFNLYQSPPYFCWDLLCRDLAIVDDKDSPEYNLRERVESFSEFVNKQSASYATSNILVTMGGDFTMQAATIFYTNMDKLIKGFKQYDPNVNLMYSTPSCYVKAVNSEARRRNFTLGLKNDDFFPYASDEHSYWTGYYTSRPNSKRFEREGNNFLQVAKQLMTFQAVLGKDFSASIVRLKETMGIMQHHDAITGTEKQHVVDDYVRLMTIAMKEGEKHVPQMVVNLLSKGAADRLVQIPFESCLLSNVSHCGPSGSDRFAVVVYNPLSRIVSHYVRLPVNATNFTIRDLNGNGVSYAVMPQMHNFSFINSIGLKPSQHELVFKAEQLPPLGFRYYYVERFPGSAYYNLDYGNTDPTIGWSEINFQINSTTGLLKSITINGTTLKVKQEFLYYQSQAGFNYGPENRASGAYIFRPKKGGPLPATAANFTYKIYKDPLVHELHQEVNDWIKQIIRVYPDSDCVEFDFVVGSLNEGDLSNIGVEVISRFTTELDTGDVFFTDANGRQLVKRIRNRRETFEYSKEEPESGNYYPVTSRIVLRDSAKNVEFSVVNDRSQGGSSLHPGQIELMVHRKTLTDDGFGVEEALNEREFGKGLLMRGRHYVTFGPIKARTVEKSGAALARGAALKKLLAPWTFIGNATNANHTFSTLKTNLDHQFSGLKQPFPENVHILTLEQWTNTTILLRLEHIFAEGEDARLSRPATVNLKDVFSTMDVVRVVELSLGANQLLSEINRLKWFYNGSEERVIKEPRLSNLEVTLNPMEIRTFEVEVKMKTNSADTLSSFFVCLVIVSVQILKLFSS